MNSDNITKIYSFKKSDLVSKKIYCDWPFKFSIRNFFQNDSLFLDVSISSDSFYRGDVFYSSLVLHNV